MGDGTFVEDRLWKKIIRYSEPAQFEQVQANDNDAYVPEKWAAESILTLNEKMVFANTVHREFEDEIAEFGDVVHTREPGQFDSYRKQNDSDSLETQDATSRKVAVELDQRFYVSFVIYDGERSLSFKDLIRVYLRPAVIAQARLLDRSVAAESLRFRTNAAGGLMTITGANAHDYLLDTRKVMNDNKVGLEGRMFAHASASETALQKVQLFKDAGSVGDDGTALAEAMLGRKEGFDHFLELNLPSVRGATAGTLSTTTTAAVTAGSTVIPFTSVTGLAVGDYFVVAGDNSPLRVESIATLDVTVTTPTVNAIANGAAISTFKNLAVDQSSAVAAGDKTPAVSDGYPQYWAKWMQTDTASCTPYIGQMVAFAGATAEYIIIDVRGTDDAYEIMLDRPLEASVADNAAVNLGPNGDINFAYQKDAIALVNRPLDIPVAGTGARASTFNSDGVALRVVITYDGTAQGHRVTIDGLFGKKTLNSGRGAVMYG